ncbi:MAG TPA: precorrin-6y C5,15-methyltransferase (decarboxylating) subunit CbiE [Candidatus Aquicultor sp.]|jgi:precorrin-6y C5,15-methyltransferase (decarboxylating) CbiE subunit
MVTVIGMGPGSREYVTPAAKQSIQESDIVIGARRVLDIAVLPGVIGISGKEVYEVTGNIDTTLSLIRKNCEKHVAVLVSGDPGFYSLLQTIRTRMPDIEVSAVPGISSMQLLFGLIGESWYDVKFISVHGRPIDVLDVAAQGHKKICILTDTSLTGEIVARYLLSLGIAGRAVAGMHLSYPNQQVIDTTVQELASMNGLESCVLYIEVEG